MTADQMRTVIAQRRLDAPPYRVFRAWAAPDELITWFPDEIEGSLATGTRSTLIFPDQRIWWDVIAVDPDRHFQFRWPQLPNGELATTVSVTITPRGYGSLVTVSDGPFDLAVPGALDAYGECSVGWGEALANLRAVVDYSVDLRRYRSG